ncbi:hypothetical protein B0H16DRAFT_1888512 [Mycena metata]|uniref:Uncharacterized protein n=1 Tax=Mycena metata TaxID=1033252 RepID=A0AAD7ISN7_9AGAR|nr:hypothetical protein B0H16DRAFT_1888512 [Mycena metata]
MLFVGMPTGFGRIKTLTDASVRHCDGDIKEFRPSVMVGVPAVWETIRKGIVGKVQAGGALRSTIINDHRPTRKPRLRDGSFSSLQSQFSQSYGTVKFLHLFKLQVSHRRSTIDLWRLLFSPGWPYWTHLNLTFSKPSGASISPKPSISSPPEL